MDSQYEILKNEHVFQNYFKITINIHKRLFPKPGQFYQIRCSTTMDPFLRRPFSLHRLLKEREPISMEILYRIVGRGTEWLSKREKGEFLDILGPFGNGFIIDDGMEPVILVSRGIGIAPLYAIAEKVAKKEERRKIFILMGARLGERIFYEEECKRYGEVFIYTDNGSKGFHGRAPDLLAHLLENKQLPERFSLYACGPARMLKGLAEIAKRFGLPGQVALEDHMGCGFGACLSCACPLKPKLIKKNKFWARPALQWSEDGSRLYSLICKDGPVYDIQEVDWDEWIS